jgi:glutathione S-transferase
MYTLYAYPNSYAMTAHAVLEETGAPYEVKWVQIFTDDLDEEFVSISPHGRVPALRDGDTTIFETGAIAYYVAERHPDSNLIVGEGEPQRAAFLQWFHYLASTLQADVMIQFHPEIYFPGDSGTQKRFLEASIARLGRVMETIEEGLTDGPYFCGERRSIVDYLFVMQAVWPEIFPTSADDYPRIKRLIDTLVARPAVSRVYDLHMQEKRFPIKADGTTSTGGYGLDAFKD